VKLLPAVAAQHDVYVALDLAHRRQQQRHALPAEVGELDGVAPPIVTVLVARRAGRCDQRASPPIRLTEPDTITTPKT
jgi:hypothetical protein